MHFGLFNTLVQLVEKSMSDEIFIVMQLYRLKEIMVKNKISKLKPNLVVACKDYST